MFRATLALRRSPLRWSVVVVLCCELIGFCSLSAQTDLVVAPSGDIVAVLVFAASAEGQVTVETLSD